MLIPVGLFLLALLAFSISAVTGGGAGLLMLPVLGLALPGAQVPAALTLATASSSLSRLAVFYRSIHWHMVAWFVPAAVPAVVLGAWLLSSINPLYVEALVGLLLVANLPEVFRSPGKRLETYTLSKVALLLIGAAAGFVSGLTGAVGLLFNRFYLRYGLSKEQIVATRAANEILLHLIKLGLYAAFGLLTEQVGLYGGIVAVAAILSTWGVKRVLPLLPEHYFRQIGYAAMVASGLYMLGSAGGRISHARNIRLAYAPIASGAEAKLFWDRGAVALEFELDEGFEYEREITLADLAIDRRRKAEALIPGSNRFRLEEVFGIGKHGYELYLFHNGTTEQVEL